MSCNFGRAPKLQPSLIARKTILTKLFPLPLPRKEQEVIRPLVKGAWRYLTNRCPYRAFGRHLIVQLIGNHSVSQRGDSVT
jgi:hypothetical protein